MRLNCCRNLIKAANLHLIRVGSGSLLQSRHLSSSSHHHVLTEDPKSTFLNVYSTLKSDLLHDPSFEFTDESRLWVERVRSPFPFPFLLSYDLTN